MVIPIIDLHCDLLSFLEENSSRTAHDPDVHCSIPQLKAGSVKLQVLAAFTRTGPDSVRKGLKQIDIFKTLPEKYLDFTHYPGQDDFIHSNKITIALAIENASGFCDESEPLEVGLKRLRSFMQNAVKPMYISLTWNMENRFGGGNAAKTGLKEDGKYLLEELHQKKIAVDLSHTSDALADGILDYIEHKNLDIPILASHSNVRRAENRPRNLPDAIAKEIFRRKGIIGLNFFREFVGSSADDFVKHIAHWLEMGGEQQICFGADFFYEGDTPNLGQYAGMKPYFDGFEDATCYERLLELFKKELRLSDEILQGLAYRNVQNYLQAFIN